MTFSGSRWNTSCLTRSRLRIDQHREKAIDKFIKILLILNEDIVADDVDDFENKLDNPASIFYGLTRVELYELASESMVS